MRAFLVACLVVALAPGAGCARRDPSGGSVTATDAGPPVDVALMAFLSEARARHHEANLLEESGDVRGAMASLEKLVLAPRPRGAAPYPEIDEVLADAYARLAELALRAGDLDAADRALEAGLAHATETTYFRGHLLEVRGIALESRAAALADAGRGEEAARARNRALDLLQQAIDVQEKVIGRALRSGADAGNEGERR
jgi:tetratricopeptide (TPR) repeat protein